MHANFESKFWCRTNIVCRHKILLVAPQCQLLDESPNGVPSPAEIYFPHVAATDSHSAPGRPIKGCDYNSIQHHNTVARLFEAHTSSTVPIIPSGSHLPIDDGHRQIQVFQVLQDRQLHQLLAGQLSCEGRGAPLPMQMSQSWQTWYTGSRHGANFRHDTMCISDSFAC